MWWWKCWGSIEVMCRKYTSISGALFKAFHVAIEPWFITDILVQATFQCLLLDCLYLIQILVEYFVKH
jgi:hypothetical protein